MEPYFIAIAARCAERIISVLLAGLAIYYGFRLFLVVPVETRVDGKIHLPGMSVVLAKAGPGLFFAAFGVIVIITSLVNGITFEDDLMKYQGMVAQRPRNPPSQTDVTEKSAATPQDVARVRLAIKTLNCLRQLSKVAVGTIASSDVDLAIQDSKLALLHGVWNAAEWGDWEKFRGWAAGTVQKTTSPAGALFEGERTDCPR